MLSTTRSRLLYAAVALAIVATMTGLYAVGMPESTNEATAAPSDGPRMIVAKTWSPQLTVTASSPLPGILEFSADAVVTQPFYDTHVWFSAEVRSAAYRTGQGEDDWKFDVPWRDDSNNQAGRTRVPRLAEVKPKLPLQRVPVKLPPGQYRVLVRLLEDTPSIGLDGNEHPTEMAGRTTDLVEVK